MEYTIINGSDSDEVSDSVNEKLKEGWELHGDLKVIGGTPNTYAQAMVKQEHYVDAIDSHPFVTIDELDGIKYALNDIAEAIQTAATALGYVAMGVEGKPSDKPQPAKKASRKKR
jgi:hypothetical protein